MISENLFHLIFRGSCMLRENPISLLTIARPNPSTKSGGLSMIRRRRTDRASTPSVRTSSAKRSARPKKNMSDADRQARLESLIAKVRSESKTTATARSNPKRERSRSRVAVVGEKLTPANIKTAVDNVKNAQALYNRTKSATAKRKLDTAKRKLKKIEARLKADQKAIKACETTLESIGMRANPKRRRRKASSTRRKASSTRRKASSTRRSSTRRKSTTTRRRKATTTRRRKATTTRRKSTTTRRKSTTTRRRKPTTTRRRKATTTRRRKATTTRRRSAKRRISTTKRRRNPSSSRRRTSSTRRKSRKTGLPASVKRAIRSYTPHKVYIVRGGKQMEVKVQRSSADYKKAKRSGLFGKFRALYSKKNDFRVLHITSVRDAFGKTRPATKSEVQQALNVWAGAFDGGHIVRHSRRANPMGSIRALGMRHNPTALGMRHNPMGMGAKALYGAGSFVASLATTNALSSLAKTHVHDSIYSEIGAHVVSASLPAYYLLKGGQKSEEMTVASYGWLAGVAGTAMARLIKPASVGSLPLIGKFFKLTNIGDDSMWGANSTAGIKAMGSSRKLLVASDSGNRVSVYNKGVGRYVPYNYDADGEYAQSSALSNYFHTARPSRKAKMVSRTIRTPISSKGRMGEYLLDHSLNGMHGAHGMHGMHGAMGLYRQTNRSGRMIQSGVVSSEGNNNPLLSQPEIVQGGAYAYNPNAPSLASQLVGLDPLDGNEMVMEGFDDVAVEGTCYVRALPDYARRIADENLGMIIGPSRVIQGSMIIQLFSHAQAIVDRAQIGGQPDVPRGASFPRRAGVFSNSIFASTLPSVDNGYSFLDGNVSIG